MSMLFDVIFTSRARGTHHKLALDSLRFIRGEASLRWRNLFLNFHEAYLEGATAPDDLFKDFKNHVLHVGENFWGGAPAAAERWFIKTVDAFEKQSWEEGVYAAGVLSHYFTDPFQPLHSAQSETENALHRAAEWSIAQSYGELQHILEEDLGGYPDLEAPDHEDWLGEMIRDGARRANAHYQTVIDHYNLQRGVEDPPAGLDQELKDALAEQVGRAVVGFSRVLEIVFEETDDVLPPEIDITLQGFLASLQSPVYWLTRTLSEARERAGIRETYAEFQRTGKVIATLSEDHRTIRRLHAQEVLQVPLARLDAEPVSETGILHGEGLGARSRPNRPLTGRPQLRQPVVGQVSNLSVKQEHDVNRAPRVAGQVPTPPVTTTTDSGAARSQNVPRAALAPPRPAAVAPAAPTPSKAAMPQPRAESPPAPAAAPAPRDEGTGERFHLEPGSPIALMPSIGPKTADRLGVLNVGTVSELLELIPETAAARLQSRFITAETIRDWQAQAKLSLQVPELRGHDAQILVACGIREPSHLVGLDPQALFTRVQAFCNSPVGERVLRNGARPDIAEVSRWIKQARAARTVRAA